MRPGHKRFDLLGRASAKPRGRGLCQTYDVYMHTKKAKAGRGAPAAKTSSPKRSNNDRLRALLSLTNLTQAEALALFNRELGPAAYSMSAWKAFFVSSASTRFRPLKDALLEHAEKVLKKHQVRR